MSSCKNIIHPFHEDPGTSQQERLMPDLDASAPKIDARTMADLLQYFTKLAGHINYYDSSLSISDWQSFFNKSLPFNLAAISRYDTDTITLKFELYKSLFLKRPGKTGLQLLMHFVYYSTIYRINSWHLAVKESGLPFAHQIQNLVQDRLQDPLHDFIGLVNAAVREHCIRSIDFTTLLNNDIWGIDSTTMRSSGGLVRKRRGRLNRLIGFVDALTALWPSLTEAVRLLGSVAGDNIEASLFKQSDALKQQHSPHLALVFAFLKLFQHLQADLNSFTKKHLDFFFKDVLRLQPRPAVADKAHILFEIQKQLDSHLLRQGIQVKDAKDKKNAEIRFELDSEIVVNKAQVEVVRTLFLNTKKANDNKNLRLLEGVYIAPNATRADGIKEDFKDGDPKNWPTLGAQFSRFTDVGESFPEKYPYARLGFVLASPVLLLNEGTRTINIQLTCKRIRKCPVQPFEEFINDAALLAMLNTVLTTTFVIITKDSIALARKKGISALTINELTELLPEIEQQDCCTGKIPVRENSVQMSFFAWENGPFKIINDDALRSHETTILREIFLPRQAFNISFSGKDAWITGSEITISSIPAGSPFQINIEAILNPDKPAITFFDKEKLKEDFNTTHPLVKIEIDNELKASYSPATKTADCCFENCPTDKIQYISLYHLLRDVVIINSDIKVQVCGLKNFIVQNDENVMSVNGPVYPFGTRPDLINFNVINADPFYCINRVLIADAIAVPVAAGTINHLNLLIAATGQFIIGTTEKELDDFLATIPGISNADKAAIKDLFKNNPGKYKPNVAGPGFYIGSEEIFCKNWQHAWLNVNWKEKPLSFNDHYKAYLVRDIAGSKIFGLNESDFQMNISVLNEGLWRTELGTDGVTSNPRTVTTSILDHFNRRLFADDCKGAPPPVNPCERCDDLKRKLRPVDQVIEINSKYFSGTGSFNDFTKTTEYTVDSKNGFLKLTLENQDFLHDEYAFVLGRQMMALGRYPDALIEGAVYEDSGGTVIVFLNFGQTLLDLKTYIEESKNLSEAAKTTAQNLYNSFVTKAIYTPPIPDPAVDPPPMAPPPLTDPIDNSERNDIYYEIFNILSQSIVAFNKATQVFDTYDNVKDVYSIFNIFLGNIELKPLKVLIPKEPWTPVIKNLEIDYTASANLSDISLIHLYPFENTHKTEEITLQPTLFPAHCEEGTLYIGLKQLVPGTNINFLFQLAEATANSEAERAEIVFHYLANNQWLQLRKGFEILEDATNGLTTSGIVKISIPGNINTTNTILPDDLHWIKASASQNVIAVSETMGIHTQAVLATFTNSAAHDQLRLNEALEANKLSKLLVADANIKKVIHPYESFGGGLPEAEGMYYVRVSEWLRHKGRGIQKFDYERLVLDAFPQIYKVKCINHDFGLNALEYRFDVNAAPGYVLVAVIPDLNKLKSGQSLEPKAPVSLLEQITAFLKKRTSAFARIKVMNPRYETIDLCLTVKLMKGRDKTFYKNQLETDLRLFLAPWAVGEFDKLTFGQCINRSDIVRFIEGRDYVDFIVCFRMQFENDCTGKDIIIDEVCPLTPRSILVGGLIDVCIEDDECVQQEPDYCSKEFEVTTVTCKTSQEPEEPVPGPIN